MKERCFLHARFVSGGYPGSTGRGGPKSEEIMNSRKPSGRGNDRDLWDEPPAPSQSGSGGGGLATEIGSKDDERGALGGDPEPTRVHKGDRTQPVMAKKSDNEGAQRRRR